MTGNYSYTPYIWPMFASAIVSATVAVYAWRRRTVPGATAFVVYLLFIAIWALLTGIEMAAAAPLKALYYWLEAIAGLTSLSALLGFALEHAGLGKWATRRNELLISLVSLCFIVLAATNDLHHLIWTRMWFDRWVRIERGPLNPLFFGWGLLLPTLAILVFLRLLLRSGGIYRRQALVLFIGSLLPFLTFFLEPAGINPVAPLDPVILVLNVSSLLYAVAIFRFRMLEVVPIGRDTAIERMNSGVLVLDAENRIADLNPAAGQVLALSRRATIGRPAGQALADYPDFKKFLELETVASAEITLPWPSQPRYFQVQASPLTHPGGFRLGRLILLQDVTEQRRAQAQIMEQQRALAALQEREHLARELHDSVGQTLGYVSYQVEAARKLLDDGQVALANAQLARLAGIAQDAHADVREYILGLRASPLAQQPFFSTLRQYLDGFTHNYNIPAELVLGEGVGEGAFELEAQAQLFRIIQEALSNARRHANARRVQVRFETEDSLARIIIQDDGRGFDLAQPASGGENRFGLQFMRERAEQLGGGLRVQSAPGEGTRVVVEVPMTDSKQ